MDVQVLVKNEKASKSHLNSILVCSENKTPPRTANSQISRLGLFQRCDHIMSELQTVIIAEVLVLTVIATDTSEKQINNYIVMLQQEGIGDRLVDLA